VDELLRATIHDALDVQEPAGLRTRVLRAVPIDQPRRKQWRMPAVGGQWVAAFAAILLTVALLAALVYTRAGLPSQVDRGHTPASGARLVGPTGIAVGPDGTIYVADYISKRVYRLQAGGGLVTVAGGGLQYEGVATKANLFYPEGLAVAANGDLYIADNEGSTIRRLDRTGRLSTFVSVHASGGALTPFGIAFDKTGTLYVGNLGGDVVGVEPDGSQSAIDLSGIPAPVVQAGYLAFDQAGNLYVADGSPFATLPGQVPPPPGGCRIIKVAPDRSTSVIAGTGTCGFSGDGGPAVSAQLDNPMGIAVDAAGNLYIADSHNYRIRRIDTHGVITTIAGKWGTSGHSGDGGPAVNAVLGSLSGLAIVQGRYLYVSEVGGFNAYGAVRAIDLQTGTIRTVVDSYSKVVS
jgi:sugar lactone lactonase YvrE